MGFRFVSCHILVACALLQRLTVPLPKTTNLPIIRYRGYRAATAALPGTFCYLLENAPHAKLYCRSCGRAWLFARALCISGVVGVWTKDLPEAKRPMVTAVAVCDAFVSRTHFDADLFPSTVLLNIWKCAGRMGLVILVFGRNGLRTRTQLPGATV
jgi:hypothetical protein